MQSNITNLNPRNRERILVALAQRFAKTKARRDVPAITSLPTAQRSAVPAPCGGGQAGTTPPKAANLPTNPAFPVHATRREIRRAIIAAHAQRHTRDVPADLVNARRELVEWLARHGLAISIAPLSTAPVEAMIDDLAAKVDQLAKDHTP